MIEHRCSKRVDTALEVSLYQQGWYLAGGKVLNVSQDGLFVATDVAPSKHTFLEVILSLPSKQGEKHYRFFSIVVHVDECGVGLHVDALIPKSRSGLSALLKYSEESDLRLEAAQ
jgi:hypothetical protein